eukprot:UN21633
MDVSEAFHAAVEHTRDYVSSGWIVSGREERSRKIQNIRAMFKRNTFSNTDPSTLIDWNFDVNSTELIQNSFDYLLPAHTQNVVDLHHKP